MKKRITALLFAACAFTFSVGFSSEPSQAFIPEITAAPTAAPTTVPTVAPTVAPTAAPAASSLDFKIKAEKRSHVIADTIKLELYDMNDTLLASYSEQLDGDTTELKAHFDVPEYALGESFRLKNAGGVNYIKYQGKYAGFGNSIIVSTDAYIGSDGKEYPPRTEFTLICEPRYEKEICLYFPDGMYKPSERARLMNGVTMVPVRQVAEKLGLKVRYDKTYNSVVCSAGKDEIIFNIGKTYTTVLGTDIYAPHAPCYINGSVFVPLRTLADGARSSLEVLDFGDHFDIILGASELVKEYRNKEPVNRDGIASDTSYLVWISKREFKVRVYTGSRYNWELVKTFPCAIGAPGSETVTGTFKYQYRMSRWEYNTYYVGPALVFYGNYAMHSTLLNYGGGEYDGRVGVKISHGCVRLHPQDINWIDCYVPVKSTVYITE